MSNEKKVDELNGEEKKHSQVKKTKIGVVTGCLSLAIRDTPEVSGKLLGVLNALSEVQINSDKSNNGFYSITTKDKSSGYCMQKFITIK